MCKECGYAILIIQYQCIEKLIQPPVNNTLSVFHDIFPLAPASVCQILICRIEYTTETIWFQHPKCGFGGRQPAPPASVWQAEYPAVRRMQLAGQLHRPTTKRRKVKGPSGKQIFLSRTGHKVCGLFITNYANGCVSDAARYDEKPGKHWRASLVC